jgi:predicted MFS family arabinose efflux permease
VPVSAERASPPALIILALWLMVFSASSQVIIIAPILPRIGDALNIPEALQGTLISAYALLLSTFALITGPISDTVGRRRVLLFGCLSMTLALLLHGVVTGYLSLLAMRALAGAAGGMLSGAAVAYVGDYFPYEKRGFATSTVMSGIAFGQIIGIPMGTLLADQFGFRAAFMMFAVTMGLATLLIFYFVPQPDVERSTSRFSLRGALDTYLDLLRNRDILAAATTYFLMFFGMGLYVPFLPTWLERTVGLDGSSIALLFLVGGLTNVTTGPLAGWVSDKTGRKPLILMSCAGLCVLMVATTYVVHNFFEAAIIFSLAMMMIAARMGPLQSLLTALVPAPRRGTLMSLVISIGQIGMGVGTAVSGIAYAQMGYLSNTLMGAVSLLLMALLVRYYLPEPMNPDLPVAAPEEATA